MNYITDISEISKMLPNHSLKDIQDLYFIRTGKTKNSFMKINGLQTVLNGTYKFRNNTFQKQKSNKYHLYTSSLPEKFIDVNITLSKNNFSGEGNNILGQNNILYLDKNTLQIPVLEATSDNLGYYGARLIRQDDIFYIPEMPIWNLSVGENYMKDFMFTELSGGMYIEYHNYIPHFHSPLNKNSSGYYILGKKIDNVLRLTGFRIPYGKAVYTEPGTYHCDAGLVGDWLVGYNKIFGSSGNFLGNIESFKSIDKSNVYSTYLIRNKKGIVNVEFIV